MGSKSSKPASAPGLLFSPENRYTFTMPYYDYEDFLTKIYKVLDEQVPYEENKKWIKNQPKEMVLDCLENWISLQPEKERDHWKKYLMDGIFDLGRKFSTSQLQSKSTFSPESASSPKYARYTLNVSYNTAEEFWTLVNEEWNEFPSEERKKCMDKIKQQRAG